MAAENRKFRRKLVSANVLIHENGNKPVKGSLTNISCGGVGLNSSLLNLHIGSRVIIEIETLRGLPRMQIKGRIVQQRFHSAGGISQFLHGLEFEGLTQLNFQRISAYILSS